MLSACLRGWFGWSGVIVGSCIIAGGSRAGAAVIAVGPFAGDVTETFNQFSQVMAVQSLGVFGGHGTLQNLSPGGAIKVEFASLFQGHQVVPISGMMAGQLGVGQWTFDTPVIRFGGMFENNSGQDDATVAFYDAGDRLIGEVTAGIPFGHGWTWIGWQSDTPFTRIVVTGNGIVNGFLWYENMQVTFAPGPPAGALLILAGAARRRRATRRQR